MRFRTSTVVFMTSKVIFVLLFALTGVTGTLSGTFWPVVLHRSAVVGQTVLLPCDVPRSSRPAWKHHCHTDHRTQHIVQHGRTTRDFEDRFRLHKHGLLIHDVRLTDNGTYTCSTRHIPSGRQRKIHLFVPWEFKTIYEGDSVTLRCNAVLDSVAIWRYSQPNSDDIRIIYWLRRIFGKDRQRFSVRDPESGNYDLRIVDANRSDSGVYRCRENDGHHPGESCTKLVVIPKENRPKTTRVMPADLFMHPEPAVQITTRRGIRHIHQESSDFFAASKATCLQTSVFLHAMTVAALAIVQSGLCQVGCAS